MPQAATAFGSRCGVTKTQKATRRLFATLGPGPGPVLLSVPLPLPLLQLQLQLQQQQPISGNSNGCLFLRHPTDAPASHSLGHPLARRFPSSGYRTVLGDRRLTRRRPFGRSPPGPVPFRFVCLLVSRRSGSTLASKLLLSVG